jgi:hypothetical protein
LADAKTFIVWVTWGDIGLVIKRKRMTDVQSKTHPAVVAGNIKYTFSIKLVSTNTTAESVVVWTSTLRLAHLARTDLFWDVVVLTAAA